MHETSKPTLLGESAEPADADTSFSPEEFDTPAQSKAKPEHDESEVENIIFQNIVSEIGAGSNKAPELKIHDETAEAAESDDAADEFAVDPSSTEIAAEEVCAEGRRTCFGR